MSRILSFLFLLAISLPTALFSQGNLDSGLVARYPFSGNAIDESGRGNDGMVSGATLVPDRFGNQESAYYFDGIDDFINLDDRFDFRFTADFSISLWIYYPGDKSQNSILQRGIILQKRDELPPYNQYGIALGELNCCYVLDSNRYVSIFYRHDQNYEDKFLEMENQPLGIGWHHIVVVNKNFQEFSAYLDGQYIGTSQAGGGTFEVPGYPLFVGASSDSGIGDHFYEGAIDDISIYNRILTLSEIDSLYMEDLTPTSIGVSEIAASFSLHPNPSSGSFTIEGEQVQALPLRLSVFNLLGQQIRPTIELAAAMQWTHLIDLSDQPNGVYQLRLDNGQQMTHKQLLLQR